MDIITKVAPVDNTSNAPADLQEEWRLVIDPRIKDIYEISNLGRIRNKNDKQLLHPRLDTSRKYLRVSLMKAGQYGTCYTMSIPIHRMVAIAFLSPPPEGAKVEVDHIDGDSTNNRADNLRWVSKAENANNPVTVQRRSAAVAKIRPKIAVRIFCEETGETFESIEKAAARFGIDPETARTACLWAETAQPGEKRRKDAFPYHLRRINPVKAVPSLAERLKIALAGSNQEHAIPVRCLDDEIEIIFPSASAAAKAYNIHHKTVRGSCELFARGAARHTHFSRSNSKHFAVATKEEYAAWVAKQKSEL